MELIVDHDPKKKSRSMSKLTIGVSETQQGGQSSAVTTAERHDGTVLHSVRGRLDVLHELGVISQDLRSGQVLEVRRFTCDKGLVAEWERLAIISLLGEEQKCAELGCKHVDHEPVRIPESRDGPLVSGVQQNWTFAPVRGVNPIDKVEDRG